MTEYQLALINYFTKDDRKPVFIENAYTINEETPLEDILYTYNEMANRGYLIEERGFFLEDAAHYSKKQPYNFLYPDVILDVPYEVHPFVKAMKEAFKKEQETGVNLTMEEWDEIYKLKDW